jgi:divinyl chlorophyllide a 8-vinyl-reductase
MFFRFCFVVCIVNFITNNISLLEGLNVVIAGATGYIGRQVVKELVQRGISTTSLIRSTELSKLTKECLNGSNLVLCDVLNSISVDETFSRIQPTVAIVCLASRSGVRREAWSVDYQGGANILRALEKYNPNQSGHYVLLSAFCVGKPQLQFQFAKIKLEEEIRSLSVTHSIVRPTAFFKSLDGQIDNVKKGSPIIYFGSGECAANPISDKDLAKFLVDCALKPKDIGMFQSTRNIGGPDVPPITKLEQGHLIYDTLKIPLEKRRFVSIPLEVLDFLIGAFSFLEKCSEKFSDWFQEFDQLQNFSTKLEDAAEITRIIKYYASEPMVATGEREVQGEMKLQDHFRSIARSGGQLEEIDKMTTTAGILEVFVSNEYVK